ncbi:hypothetical protein [Sphingobacterium lumbrici]|uniref:hypothetical protein n=1 Tax=Sphingobacterium lumbrici TaxID=2559600 RepID=UPI0011298BB3|nr:hypothetical protein [Sphingobacterium lumbrici]
MKHILYFAITIVPFLSTAQEQRIDNFIVKENLTQNGKIAIIAVDSAEVADERIDGTFLFSMNGLQQSLQFHQGVAVPSQKIDGSTFVFFKHKNQDNSTGRLYFIYKNDNSLKPYKVNGLLLLIIPVLLLLIAYIFKRMLLTLVILGLIYGYLSFSKGLAFTQIIESTLQVVKNLF